MGNEVFDSDELFQEDCNIELEKVNMSNVFEAGVQDFCEYQLMSLEDYNKQLATKMVWEPVVDEKEPMVELTLIECPIPPKPQTPNTPDSGGHHQLWSPPSSSGTSDEDTDYYPIVHIQRKNRKSKHQKRIVDMAVIYVIRNLSVLLSLNDILQRIQTSDVTNVKFAAHHSNELTIIDHTINRFTVKRNYNVECAIIKLQERTRSTVTLRAATDK